MVESGESKAWGFELKFYCYFEGAPTEDIIGDYIERVVAALPEAENIGAFMNIIEERPVDQIGS